MKAVCLAIVAMLLFAVTYSFYKGAEPYLSATIILFFQSLFSFSLLLPFLLKKSPTFLLSPKWFIILVRSVFALFAILGITKGLQTAALSEVVLLNNTSPLLVPPIAYFLFKEKISVRLIPGLVLGFVGIFIVLRPNFQGMNPGLIYAFASGFGSAFLLLITRKIAHESFLRVLSYYFLTFIFLLLPFVIFTTWTVPPLIVWLYLVGAAVSTVGAQLAFTASLRYTTSAQIIAPFIYTTVIFSGIIDALIWHVIPDTLAFLGMALVILGGIISLEIKFIPKKRSR